MEFLKDKLGAEDYLLPIILFFLEFFFGLKCPNLGPMMKLKKNHFLTGGQGRGPKK